MASKLCPNQSDIPPFFGLNFSIYCNTDFWGADLDPVPADSAKDCIDTCKTRWGCFGVTWDGTDNVKRCYRKNFTIYDFQKTPNYTKENHVSIMANKTQFIQSKEDIGCPWPNLSTFTTKAGLQFKVLCGALLYGDDLYDIRTDAYQFMHADNMTQCLDNCANNHPLCKRVTYDADKTFNLFFNCWLKNGTTAKPAPSVGGMRHSAYAILPTLKKPDCKNDTEIKGGGGRIFKTSCMDLRRLNDTNVQPVDISHQVSPDDCVLQCTASKSGCTSAVFDYSLESGYRNCYLFNSTLPPPVEHNEKYTFMYLKTASSQYRAPPYTPLNLTDKEKLAAEITIPLGGTLIVLALYWFWWRRRQEKRYLQVKAE